MTEAIKSEVEVKTRPQPLVPVEAVNLIVRAFGESRRAALSRMPLKQLADETTRALHVLVAEPGPGRRFAVGDIVSTQDGF